MSHCLAFAKRWVLIFTLKKIILVVAMQVKSQKELLGTVKMRCCNPQKRQQGTELRRESCK